MATVDELLNATTESQVCTIDPDTRVITVPSCYKEFGVEADEKVNRINFQCPKVVGDNIDLTAFNLYINYMNASGQYNAYLVDDVTVSGDNITFSWLLSRHVTEKSGTVNYIVCAKKSDDTGVVNEWNTKVATGTVGVGLEATAEVEEQNADVIEQILMKLNNISDSASQSYTETDPTVPAWAKTETKPLYAYSEITDAPTTLKNPNALTIKIGDTTVTYDGSEAKTVEISNTGGAIVGTIDSENNITLTGALDNGTYTLVYELEDGTTTEIGTLTVGGATYTNLLPSAVGAQGTVENDVGYRDGYYLSGNPNVNGNFSYCSSDSTHFTTGFIPYTKAQMQAGVPIYVKGVTIDTTNSHERIGAYPSYDYATYIDPIKFSAGTAYVTVTQLADQYYKIVLGASAVSSSWASLSDINYIRLSLTGTGAGVIITVNELITD